jgi:hypothetical protein
MDPIWLPLCASHGQGYISLLEDWQRLPVRYVYSRGETLTRLVDAYLPDAYIPDAR